MCGFVASRLFHLVYGCLEPDCLGRQNIIKTKHKVDICTNKNTQTPQRYHNSVYYVLAVSSFASGEHLFLASNYIVSPETIIS